MNVSHGFVEYHRRILGCEFDDFLGSLTGGGVRKSVRVNTLKSSKDYVRGLFSERRVECADVPWCDFGLFVSSDVGLPSFEHALGFYFVQEAASMLPAVLLDVGESNSVLDLCAAPGAKTTQLAQYMENCGVLVANEPNYKRIRALVYNIQRCGVSNAVVTKYDGCLFHELGLKFDRILVDAPCSGVGTAGKNRDVLREWSVGRVKRFSGLQKRLVDSAFRSLEDGGILVYSTCTTSLEENEEVVEYLLERFDSAELVRVKSAGVVLRRGLSAQTRNCLRVYPHLNGTGCYFIAKVRKNA